MSRSPLEYIGVHKAVALRARSSPSTVPCSRVFRKGATSSDE